MFNRCGAGYRAGVLSVEVGRDVCGIELPEAQECLWREEFVLMEDARMEAKFPESTTGEDVALSSRPQVVLPQKVRPARHVRFGASAGVFLLRGQTEEDSVRCSFAQQFHHLAIGAWQQTVVGIHKLQIASAGACHATVPRHGKSCLRLSFIDEVGMYFAQPLLGTFSAAVVHNDYLAFLRWQRHPEDALHARA